MYFPSEINLLIFFSPFSLAQNDKNLNEKEFKNCDRSSNLSDTKIDIRRDFTQTFSNSDQTSTRLPDGSIFNGCSSTGGGVPLAGAVPVEYR